MSRALVHQPYGSLPWYEVKVGSVIEYRSPFTGPHVARVVEKQSSEVMKLRFEDGNEKWVTTNNLTLESINDV